MSGVEDIWCNLVQCVGASLPTSTPPPPNNYNWLDQKGIQTLFWLKNSSISKLYRLYRNHISRLQKKRSPSDEFYCRSSFWFQMFQNFQALLRSIGCRELPFLDSWLQPTAVPLLIARTVHLGFGTTISHAKLGSTCLHSLTSLGLRFRACHRRILSQKKLYKTI